MFRLFARSWAVAAVLIWAGSVSHSGAVRWELTPGARRALAPVAQPASVRAPSAEQVRLADEAVGAGTTVEWDKELGTPSLIRARDLRPAKAISGNVRSSQSTEQAAMSVLENVGGLLGARDPASEFVLRGVVSDNLGFQHARMNQFHNGRRVVGGQVIVHFNDAGEAYQVNGRFMADLTVDDVAAISANEAFITAKGRLEAAGCKQISMSADPELVVFAFHSAPALAYEAALSCATPNGHPGKWRLWISATDGRVLLAVDEIRHVLPPTDSGSPVTINGFLLAGEGGSSGNPTNVPGWRENTGRYYLHNPSQCWYIFNWAGSGYMDNNTYANRITSDWGVSDRDEISAANNFRHIQNYFRNVHGRASYNNSNTMARVNVHYGQNYPNSFWDGNSFNFGDGNGVEANSMAVLDIAAHEFGHAVMDHTAALFHYGESGALNESFSDIWGACVEFYAQPDGRSYYPGVVPGTADWMIGEDCWLDGAALRDMRNPRSEVTLVATNRQPSRYQGTLWGNTTNAIDNGYVYKNGGVQNFMFYLLSDGGAGDNDGIAYNVTGIGLANAAKVAYRALTVYFTTYTDYSDARRCWVSAAGDFNTNWVANVGAAWDAVGVGGDQLSPSLGQAVNAPSLPWYTGGAVANNWFAQSQDTYDGVLAAKSGAINHNQDTRILTVVQGPGSLSYYWKVSSEGNADFLMFFIDNKLMDRISGTVTWHQMTNEVSRGTHTLKWVYQKNLRTTVGDDAGWLDVFTWTPFYPETPVGFNAGDGATSAGIQLSWQPARHADWYEVWRGPTSEPVYASKVGKSFSTNFLDASVLPLQISYYWVVAANANGTSSWSACDFGYRSLPAPEGVTASAGLYNDALQVAWQAVSNATKYEVWRSTSPGISTATPMSTNLTDLSFRDTTAVSGTAYYYWVRARGFVVSALANIGAFSAPVSGWRFIPPPENMRASNGDYTDKVRITWDTVAGANSYEVWRSLTPELGAALKITTSNPTEPVYDDTSVLIEVMYYYWVRAISSVGASAYSLSDAGWRASPTVPSAPTNVVASDGSYSNKVRVTWARVDVANTYEVWRSTVNDSSTAEWLDNTAGTRYDDFDVVIGTVYYYWIKAKGDGGTGGFSDSDSGFAVPGGGPEPVDHAYNDYNGDGVSDLAVYAPNSGLWFVTTAQGLILAWNFAWGGPGLVPAPGDYQGTGFTHYSVYSPAYGSWYIRTGAGIQLAWDLSWGGGGLISVYGDYNGDAISDLAVYDMSSGAWYVRNLTGTIIMWAVKWGGPGFWPVPGDYDGDGRYDLAVYDSASGNWYILSALGYTIVAGDKWGGPGFEPVMGDYNGDMLSDLAVYDRATGAWYIKTVYGSYIAWGQLWGGSGFDPVPGDFNGDGRADMAVYSPQTGQWFIRTVYGLLLTWGMPWGGPGFEVVRGTPCIW